MSKKRASNSEAVRVPGGYPAVADSTDEAAYEWQRSFVYGWFNEKLERLKGDDVNAARSARAALEPLFLEFIALLDFAEAGRDEVTKQWAGRLLANIWKRIEKHDEKLCAANPAYRQERERIGSLRTDVLSPRSKITRIVQQELATAFKMRRWLLMLRGVVKKQSGRKWRKKWQEVIEALGGALLEEYLPAVRLPPFSVKSEPRWWKFLWPLIKKKIDRLKLSPLAQHDPKSGGVKARKRYKADSETTARDHLKLLARLKDERRLFLLKAFSS
jgi:hypothetical protein